MFKAHLQRQKSNYATFIGLLLVFGALNINNTIQTRYELAQTRMDTVLSTVSQQRIFIKNLLSSHLMSSTQKDTLNYIQKTLFTPSSSMTNKALAVNDWQHIFNTIITDPQLTDVHVKKDYQRAYNKLLSQMVQYNQDATFFNTYIQSSFYHLFARKYMPSSFPLFDLSPSVKSEFLIVP